MKKLLLASAVAALSVSAAQAAPTVYGKAFLTLDSHSYSGDYDSYVYDAVTDTTTHVGKGDIDATRTDLNSNASRIGFKGSEALTANTDLVYQLEYGVKVDDNSTQFGARDTYLGLANKQYGTLLAGRLKGIDGLVDFANVTEGGVLGGDNVLASFDAPRFNNTLAYVSPSYNGVTFMGAYVMDENRATDTLDRDAFQLAAKYEQAALKAGLAYTQAGDFKATRVSGAYNVSPALTLGALYQVTDFHKDSKKENAFTVSGEMKTATPWTAYGQVDVVSNLGGVADAKRDRLVLGGKYAFNKNTTGHVYAAYLKDKNTVNYAEVDADAGLAYYEVDNFKAYGVGAGIEYKF